MANFNEYNVQIAGFKSNIEDFRELIQKIDQISNGCTIQLLNADGIAGKEHVFHATVHAIKSFERNENIAKDLGLEICVRTSAQRQISKALDILGLKKGKMKICVVSINCSDDTLCKLDKIIGEKDESVLNPDVNVLKKNYEISDMEIEVSGGISYLLMERTSLLTLDV